MIFFYISVERIADIFMAKNKTAPMNSIWCYYVITKNEAASRKIWNEHLQSASFIKFTEIIRKIADTSDEELAKTLLEYLKSNQNISAETIGHACSKLLHTQITNNNLNAGLALVHEIANGIGIKHIAPAALKKLKNKLEETGTEFPFDIPADA